MDSDRSVTLNYLTEYALSFEQIGSSEPVYITVDGAQVPDPLPQSLWVLKDSTIMFNYPSVVTDNDGTTRYVLTGVLGNTTDVSVTIHAPTSVTGFYKTQYYMTVISLHDSPTPSQWVDRGHTFTASVVSPTEIIPSQTQWKCVGFVTDGLMQIGTSHTYDNVQKPHTIEFLWVQQFWLQVDTAVSETPVEGTGWYDGGTSATLSVITPHQPSLAHRFVFSAWTSTGSNDARIADPTSSETTVIMNNYYTVQANWQEEWYITVISLRDDPTPSQWVNTADNLTASVTSPADNDGAGTRYRCIGYSVDGGDLLEGTHCTFVNVHAAHTIEFNWIAQFYVTTATNLGTVNPDSRWYDVGSIVSIEAIAPTLTAGSGYVWHGWTGTGAGSYSGTDNPATITVQSIITETAYWKIEPLVSVVLSNETLTSGDRILVHGQIQPIQPGVEISLVYQLPNGTRIEQYAYTDDDGYYEDTLFLGRDSWYTLIVDDGTWTITAHRSSDLLHENAQASTTLKVEARSASQIHPVLMAGAVLAVGLLVYAPPVKKLRNYNNGRRITLVLSLAGLMLAAVSLAVSWVSIGGTVTTFEAAYDVDVFLYPFSSGSVALSHGLQYNGAEIPSLVHPSLASVRGSVGPLVTLYLIPVGCALALTGLYRPKNARQKLLKATALTCSGLLIVAAAVHAFMFVQGQTGAIHGASISYRIGLYLTVVGGVLTVLAGLFAARENHDKSNAAAARRA
jgi:hypothetical protein